MSTSAWQRRHHEIFRKIPHNCIQCHITKGKPRNAPCQRTKGHCRPIQLVIGEDYSATCWRSWHRDISPHKYRLIDNFCYFSALRYTLAIAIVITYVRLFVRPSHWWFTPWELQYRNRPMLYMFGGKFRSPDFRGSFTLQWTRELNIYRHPHRQKR